MPRLRRRLILPAALAAVFVVAISAYDLFAFQPYRHDIDKLLAQAGRDERVPPASLTKVLQVAYTEGIDGHVARYLVGELQPEAGRSSKLGWHGTNMIWTLLLKVHLSKADRGALFLSLSYMGEEERGFQQASERILGVTLARVSLTQAATLVTIGKSPSAYLADPQRLAQSAERLSARAAGAP